MTDTDCLSDNNHKICPFDLTFFTNQIRYELQNNS